ncbi:hypothetical protein LZ554_003461 [Drepanopeziza brunnea f. sp. 'monogermtubi']|nr:hypothetical protein LZ554_003461 [Drepanopeziza brunnea f. sp. 'monogermtubi']
MPPRRRLAHTHTHARSQVPIDSDSVPSSGPVKRYRDGEEKPTQQRPVVEIVQPLVGLHVGRQPVDKRARVEGSRSSGSEREPTMNLEAAKARSKYKCRCGKHIKDDQCEAQKLAEKRARDAASIILKSQNMVLAVVDKGERERIFCLHQELLAKHSQYFTAVFAAPPVQANDVNIKTEAEEAAQTTVHSSPPLYKLPNVSATPFAHFTSWLYTGRIATSLAQIAARTRSEVCSDWTSMWATGSQLGSAGFRNYAMDGLRKETAVTTRRWPTAAEAQEVSAQDVDIEGEKRAAGEDSALGRFLVACIASNRPFEKFEGSDERKIWVDVFDKDKQLAFNVLVADKKWGVEGPWDKKFDREFAVEDETLADDDEVADDDDDVADDDDDDVSDDNYLSL